MSWYENEALIAEIRTNEQRIKELEAERDRAFNAGIEASHKQALKEINEYNDPSWNGACIAIAENIRALK